MKIMHSHTDDDGSQTTIVSVQDARVALATYFHDEDLILTDPDSFSDFDADAAEALAYGILHAVEHARAGDIRGWDAERRERVAAHRAR
ncbi:MAG: hypothetical protein WCB92_00825 [Mycobacterium sp.]